MAYSSIVKPGDYFNTKLYTGNGSAGNAQTGIGFQPDLVWLKSRSDAYAHYWFDAIRGATKQIQSNTTNAETTSANQLTAFNSDGFTLGNDLVTNGSSKTFASWNWKANGAGSANTDGSISSTVSASATSGFSIVSYTGTGANATVGHGLGSVPAMIIVKSRSVGDGWRVYHHKVSSDPETDYLVLNNTNAVADSAGYWNDTAPTSSVFSLGTAGEVNTNGSTNIAYCFKEKKGYSKFGSYTGNGSTDGTFVYTGFKPAFVMAKYTSGAGEDWKMMDSKRNPSNVTNKILAANTSVAEATSSYLDLLSNGFKIRATTGSLNNSGGSYIYMSFAEEPLVANSGSNGVPATAR